MTCTVGGCTNAVLARGWCSKHYARWRQHGTTTLPVVKHVVACDGCGAVLHCKGKAPNRWCADCKARNNRERVARWIADNPERVAAYQHRHYAETRERRRAKSDEWAARNPDKVRAIKQRYADAHREQTNARQRERYRQMDPVIAKRKRREQKMRRRSRKLNAPGRHTYDQFLALCAAADWMCAYCGVALTETSATQDHIVPLVRGGSDDIANIAPACLRCNQRKGTRTPEEWLAAEALTA